MTYETADGRRFVLATHTPAEWADKLEAAMAAAGCSAEYALAAADQVRNAQPVIGALR